MSERQLHVRVALVLGWSWKRSPTGNCRFLCPPTADNPYDIVPGDYLDATEDVLLCADSLRYVPRYHTDWAAGGHLIERYRLSVRTVCDTYATKDDSSWGWDAYDIDRICQGSGPTPLYAVCEAILALHAEERLRAYDSTRSLHAAGKLPEG